MPPRLRPSNISSTVTSCPSLRPQSVSQPARAAREFSQSSCREITQRRRAFYEWLNGPGRALKDPIPHSTNYLGAYDKYGNLVRASPGWQSRQTPKKQPSPDSEPEALEKVDSKEQVPPAQEADQLDMTVRRQEEVEQAAKKKRKNEEDSRLPPETVEDLRPFPLNQHFRSQPVLSEELREAIYQEVKSVGNSLQGTSVRFGVSNERVGAVVRLKQMEKEWIAKGKTLAIPYSKAVLAMLPTTPHIPEGAGKRPIVHEPINDLIVHPATRQQLFVPVAESRQFTRVDAGKAFDNNLLPADARIPHTALIDIERDMLAGISNEERRRRAQERLAVTINEKREKQERKRAAEARSTTTVPQRRWDFVFKDISVESAGRDGRDKRGVGWRYGLPHQDRKKGQVKIPTKVEA